MSGEMEYLYAVIIAGLSIPIAGYFLERWLRMNSSHMRQSFRDCMTKAKANYESEMARTREILRRKK